MLNNDDACRFQRYASINVAPNPEANRGLFSAAPTQQQVVEFDDTKVSV